MAGKDGCGLFCVSSIERAWPRPTVFNIGCVRLERDGAMLRVEVIDGNRRVEAWLDRGEAETLFRVLLQQGLFGEEEPTETALLTLKALLDAATSWLRSISTKRLEAWKKRRELEHTLAEVKRKLERVEEEMKSCRDEECKSRVWRKHGMGGLVVAEERLKRSLKETERSLAELEQAEQRIALAALALSHAWQALTMPDIEHLVKFYDYKRAAENRNTLLDYMAKEKAAKAAEG